MNNKGQYYRPPPQQPQGIRPRYGPHPVLIIGIIITVLPFFNNLLKIKVPTFFYPVGIVVILIGGVLSIMVNV